MPGKVEEGDDLRGIFNDLAPAATNRRQKLVASERNRASHYTLPLPAHSAREIGPHQVSLWFSEQWFVISPVEVNPMICWLTADVRPESI